MDLSSPRRTRLNPRKRRLQLLDCALSVFARDGLGRANHAAVADMAGVSVATVFHYFPNRDALVDAVLAQVDDFFIQLANEVHRHDSPLREILIAHGLAFLRAAETNSDYVRVWLDWSTAIREQVWPRYLDFQERLITIVADSIRRGRSRGEVSVSVVPEDTARLFVGNAHMAALMNFAPGSGLSLEDLVRRAVAALLSTDVPGNPTAAVS
ncbi:MAG: TetR/AcrR family transcriptional regulator [Gammaproteobacteria bacterium]